LTFEIIFRAVQFSLAFPAWPFAKAYRPNSAWFAMYYIKHFFSPRFLHCTASAVLIPAYYSTTVCCHGYLFCFHAGPKHILFHFIKKFCYLVLAGFNL